MKNQKTPSSWVNDETKQRAKRFAATSGLTALGLAGATNALAVDTSAAQAEVTGGKENVEGFGGAMVGLLAVVVIFAMIFAMMKKG